MIEIKIYRGQVLCLWPTPLQQEPRAGRGPLARTRIHTPALTGRRRLTVFRHVDAVEVRLIYLAYPAPRLVSRISCYRPGSTQTSPHQGPLLDSLRCKSLPNPSPPPPPPLLRRRADPSFRSTSRRLGHLHNLPGDLPLAGLTVHFRYANIFFVVLNSFLHLPPSTNSRLGAVSNLPQDRFHTPFHLHVSFFT